MRSILFVDGENLTLRYQQMVKDGFKPLEHNVHVRDTFIWHSNLTSDIGPGLYRANYYTSVVGDDREIENTKERIAASRIHTKATYSSDSNSFQLNPCVYKKHSRSKKTRLVDINIVIDTMRFCYTDSVDRVYLFSGDGDYRDLVSDLMKTGKQVCLGALSSGLHPALKYSVDKFINLDSCLFAEPRTA